MLAGDALAGLDEEKGLAITGALFEGRKIEAIKKYKVATGTGLKESKEKIETLEAELRKECPERFTASARTGCSVVLLVGGMLATLAGWGLT